ncbi:hypothetical protein [Fluviicola taffensis]|uniref:hypothetical protein n=1 Tax=Fluviicola taffensis TaxID=191579 RepID=UPI0031382088
MEINNNQHHTLVFLLTLLLVSCSQSHETKKPKEIDRATKKEITTTSTDSIQPKKGKQILVGYYDNYENLPQLVFDSVSEREFNKLKASKFLRSIKPKQKGNDFYVETAVRTHTFKKYKNYGEPKNWYGYQLKGIYPALKLFVLTKNSTADHLGFGELFLLDSVTDHQYVISSIGDGSVETPIPSPNNQYFVYYDNTMYELQNSDIRILKINDKENPEKYLTEYAYFNSTEFAVEQIIWKSDQCFYVKGYKQIYDESSGQWFKEFKYYRTNFK